MAASLPEPGGVLGHYRLLEQIGIGGMGVVFRARDLRLERDVALKVLPPDAFEDDDRRRKQFRHEALTLSRLNHPNIAHVYDFDTQDDIDFLAMEYVPGTTLAAKLADGPLPEAEVISLGEQISGTLADAHREGIVHCDIKPRNLMLTPAGQVKMLDFGLAQLLRISDSTTTRSLSGQPAFAGTPPYMAPEQLRGQAGNFKSDIYSVGVSLYELATGRRPFSGTDLLTLIHEIDTRTPDPPRKFAPQLSPQLQQIILTCLAKDPAERTYSAAELKDALAALHAPKAMGAQVLSPRNLWVAALILFLAAAAGITYRLTPHAATPAAGVRKLAVLPPKIPASPDATVAFGNGLIEILTARLSQIGRSHNLQVSPSSEIRDKHVQTTQEARAEFGVDLGLELTVERANDQVRVTYALIDARTRQQLNGDSVLGNAADPFALEDKLADKVVQTLNLELQPDERKALTDPQTTQPAAYDYYLRGVGYLQDFHKPENIESAITVFNHAVERDPQYALAYAGLGEAYFYRHLTAHEHEWMGPAKDACEHAIALKPDDAAGHYCLGRVLGGTGQYEAAVEQYRKASELDPSDDRIYSALANTYDSLGKPEAAEQTYRQAISLKPNDWLPYNWLGFFYLKHGRFADAASMFNQIISLAPDSFAGYTNLGGVYLEQGDYARAIPFLERSVAIRVTAANTSNLATAYFGLRQFSQAARTYEKAVALDQRNYVVWGNLGDAYYWTPAERSKANAAYQKAISLGNESLAVNPRDHEVLSDLAQYYAMNGQPGEAETYIKRALILAPKSHEALKNAALISNQTGNTGKALGYLEQAVAAGASPSDLRNTPNFDNLRALPRFQKLVGPG